MKASFEWTSTSEPLPPRTVASPAPERYVEAASLVASRRASEPGSRVIVFASAVSGEGTTTTVLGVAEVLREHYGARVLVVELNFQRPTFVQRFQLGTGNTLSSIATGDTAILTAIHPVGEGFFVLGSTSGGAPATSIAKVFREVLDATERVADVVLVDAPPLLESSEALAIAADAPSLILVTESGRTSSRNLQRVQQRLASSDVRLAGAVLNKHRSILPRWLQRWLEH